MSIRRSKKTETKNLLTRRNILDCVAVAGLILASIAFVVPLLPARARLTIFTDYTQFLFESDTKSFDLNIFTKVVNDGPTTANIVHWNASLDFNVTYIILNQATSHGELMLSPSSQTDLNFSRTIIGENDTLVPQTALRSIVVTILYEDQFGIQEARREYRP
jgi:hypothetical protein